MATVNDKAKAAIDAAVASKKTPSRVDLMCARLSSPGLIKRLEMALPAAVKKDAERFSRILVTLTRLTPGLAECDAPSVIGGALTGAALGMDPTPGLNEFYLVPFNDRRSGKKQAQFVLGYKGMLELAYRGGCQKIVGREVCKNDVFKISYGFDEGMVHEPPVSGPRGEKVGYYAIVTLPSGEKTFCYMTKEDIVAHANKKSPAYKSGPWQTDFDAMAKKTCLRQLFTWLPKSTDVSRALAKDGGFIRIDADGGETSEDVLDAQTEQVYDIEAIEVDAEANTNANANAEASAKIDTEPQVNKGKNDLTNNDLDLLQARLDKLFGEAGLGFTRAERDDFVRRTLGSEPTDESFTEPNVKRVIAAAEALLKAREG